MAGKGQGFAKYVEEPTAAQVGHGDYAKSPGTAFLRYLVEAKDAVSLCVRSFSKKQDGTWTKDSKDSLQHIITAMLPAIMGHFETYQRYLFAGMFDKSTHLTNLDIAEFSARLTKASRSDHAQSIDLRRLGAHRGLGVESVGLLLADSLTGWHKPTTVNAYFDAFGLRRKFLANREAGEIEQLWQLRHSIVHTGGTLSLPDAQKVTSLAHLGGRRLAFQPSFTLEVARKLHPVVYSSTVGMGTSYTARLLPTTSLADRNAVSELFSVKSSVSAWIPD
jgi:hypothetical protein